MCGWNNSSFFISRHYNKGIHARETKFLPILTVLTLLNTSAHTPQFPSILIVLTLLNTPVHTPKLQQKDALYYSTHIFLIITFYLISCHWHTVTIISTVPFNWKEDKCSITEADICQVITGGHPGSESRLMMIVTVPAMYRPHATFCSWAFL